MVIEKVHGLHATGLSLNERFSLLTNAAADRVPMQRKRRASAGSIISQNYNYSNRLIDQVARRLEMQAKRQAMRQRLGFQQAGGFRRFGSESSLPGLRRSNSFGNLSQQSVKSRVSWKQSNNNLSRSPSFINLRGKVLREFRKRGRGQRALQGRLRIGRQGIRQNGQVNGFQQRNRFQQNGFQRRGVQQRRGFQQRRGVQQRRGALRMNQQQNNGQQLNRAQGQQQQGQRPQVARRGRARGGGRGGITRSQSQSKLIMTKEELDAQLDQYMACTKAALDQELDNYMKNAMELE